jgi:hypothetical protein
VDSDGHGVGQVTERFVTRTEHEPMLHANLALYRYVILGLSAPRATVMADQLDRLTAALLGCALAVPRSGRDLVLMFLHLTATRTRALARLPRGFEA